jgi:DNA-binding beta-propeller fold protein YncE
VIEINPTPDSIQSLALPSKLQRCEGIAFSSSGNIIAVATSDTDEVFLFRREADGRFGAAPYWSLAGPQSRLKYPHDVSFAPSGDGELLAVAQRRGAITIYRKNQADESYGPEPIFAISGPKARLRFSDGVAFVPPDHDHLAACNLETGTISFYRKTPGSPVCFDLEPVFELQHASLAHPDGLAFSRCGKWLGVANHGNHTVSIFRRRDRISPGRKLRYGPDPVTVIKDPGLRHPHSVAFSPETHHVIVTNAGANYFSVYAPTRHHAGVEWSQTPVLRKIVGPDSAFKEINARNKMEGGPKGVAIHQDRLAICSPEHGVRIYSVREPGTAQENLDDAAERRVLYAAAVDLSGGSPFLLSSSTRVCGRHSG